MKADKCTPLTIPMTFLSPALSHFCHFVCLYVPVIQNLAKCGFCSFITQKGSCFQQCIILQLSTVLLSLQPGDPNKYITKPANYSFTQCDSRQSSPILLARHQSVLMCSHKGNQRANLMEIYKHQQRTTGIILITSLP